MVLNSDSKVVVLAPLMGPGNDDTPSGVGTPTVYLVHLRLPPPSEPLVPLAPGPCGRRGVLRFGYQLDRLVHSGYGVQPRRVIGRRRRSRRLGRVSSITAYLQEDEGVGCVLLPQRVALARGRLEQRGGRRWMER